MDDSSIEKNDDPFQFMDNKDNISNESLFEQPPTTRSELWSYYLYYNGVRKITIKRQ
jgi:hypothetical protein